MNSRRSFLQKLFVTPVAAGLTAVVIDTPVMGIVRRKEVTFPINDESKLWLQMMHAGVVVDLRKIWVERSTNQFEVTNENIVKLVKPIDFPTTERTMLVSQIGVSYLENGPTIAIVALDRMFHLYPGATLRLVDGSHLYMLL